MRGVLEARTAIEPGMAELAARHATEEEIATMARDLDAVEAHLGNARRFAVAYRQFWQHLAESTHNALLAFLSPALRAIVDSGGFVPNELYREATLERLRALHTTVARHDPEGARQAMHDLELEFLDRLSQGYPRQMHRVVAWSDLDV
jgi:DNA-binding FadR family transcriptional regulator